MRATDLKRPAVFLFCLLFVPPLAAAETIPSALEKCIGIALRNNPNLWVTRTDLSKSLINRRKALGLYFPRLRSSLDYTSSTMPSNFETDTQGRSFLITDEILSFQHGLYETLPTGGELFTRFSTQRIDTSSANVLIRPYYFSQLTFGLSQPLLKGYDWFGTYLGNSWNEFRVTNLNTRVSEFQLKDMLSQTLTDVEFAFWNLVGAKQIRDARAAALDLTNQQLEVTKKKIDAGLAVPSEIYQVQERAASRKGDLLRAQREHERARIRLGELLVLSSDELEKEALTPELELPFEPYPLPRDQAVLRFSDENLALRSLDQEVRAKELEMLRKRNLILPQLDVTGSFFLNGGNTPSASGAASGSYGGDLTELLRTRTRGWNVDVQLEVPLGKRPDFQDYRLARIEYESVKYRMAAETVRLKSRLSDVYAEVETGRELVETAADTLELAKKKLSFEQDKYNAGLTTNFNLLQFQEDLTEARIKMTEALLAYKKATTSVDALVGRTLKKFRIEVSNQDDRWQAGQGASP